MPAFPSNFGAECGGQYFPVHAVTIEAQAKVERGQAINFLGLPHDGAAPVSSHIAPAKAKTAAMGQRETKIYEDVINGGRYSFLSAPTIEGMLEGGVPIMKDGACLGAVGVSGVKSTEDAQIAKAGIAAIGL